VTRRALTTALALALAGCALTPDYERPALDVPASWEQPADAGASIANVPWFELYQDPELTRLIRIALEENKDLAASLARIEEARELLIITRADQFPFLDVFGTLGRGRQSQIVVPGAATSDNFGIGADLTFEVDLWRRYSRATEAARADLLSTEASYRNVTISLVANVASFYLLLRDLDQRLAIAERTVESRQASLAIIQARFDRGTVAELDVNQAQVELAIAQAAVASFERDVAQTANALQVLLGRSPGPVARGLQLEDQEMPLAVPPGLASELLQRRPDVVAAEEVLKAETALIGVAEALRYPSISLTGSAGGLSDELADLDTSDAKTWNLAADIFAPIFSSHLPRGARGALPAGPGGAQRRAALSRALRRRRRRLPRSARLRAEPVRLRARRVGHSPTGAQRRRPALQGARRRLVAASAGTLSAISRRT
jgi:multidrug efflux system outer membrane protein